jgi:YHS domain-containing protein
MKRDPVCNMEVREESALTAECDGELYYFCSEGCREKFLQERTCRPPRASYDL